MKLPTETSNEFLQNLLEQNLRPITNSRPMTPFLNELDTAPTGEKHLGSSRRCPKGINVTLINSWINYTVSINLSGALRTLDDLRSGLGLAPDEEVSKEDCWSAAGEELLSFSN